MKSKNLLVLLLIGSIFVLPLAETTGATAPETINGGMFKAAILTGNGDVALSGNYILLFGWSEDTYTIFGGPGLAGTKGTFSYTVTSSDSAELILSDTVLNSTINKTIVFDSPTNAFYAATNNSGGQTQTGTYTYCVPLSNSSSEWKFDKYYPWIWNHQTGWQYIFPVSAGEWVFHPNSKSWTFRSLND
jgi:hypothetical protein